jgi:hypothetical protein
LVLEEAPVRLFHLIHITFLIPMAILAMLVLRLLRLLPLLARAKLMGLYTVALSLRFHRLF